jgi:hypothetical protein
MTDTVLVCQGNRYEREDEGAIVAEEIPPPPEFAESLPDLTTRVEAIVGKVPQTRELKQPHPVIARLLKEDEARWEKWRASSYPSSFDRPFFASPFEQRRLRLLDAIFKAAEKLGMRASTHGRNPERFHIRMGEVSVAFSLDLPKAPERSNYSTPSDTRRPGSEPLRLQIHENYKTSDGVRLAWEDAPGTPLERCLADIVAGILVAGEMMVRAGMLRAHTDRVEHKAYVIREIQRRKDEAIRKEQERQARIEQASIDKLMDDAAALRMATDIRAYVEAVRSANRESPEPMSEDQMSEWASWALLQAERIDPVRSRAFLEHVEDPGEPAANSKSRSNSRSEYETQVQRPWHPNQKRYMR